MNPTPDDVLRQLRWRYAVKRFDPAQRIPPAHWQALEQALVLSPSSFGLQPWRFVVVDDRALRERLRSASWNQSQVVDADKYVVFAALRETTADDVDRYLQRTSEVRGVPVASLAGYRQVVMGAIAGAASPGALLEWNARQVYIALGQFMAAAAMLGVDTCPMEGIEPAAYDALLGFDGTRYTTLCGCAAGYRDHGDKYATAPKVRYPLDQVVERC